MVDSNLGGSQMTFLESSAVAASTSKQYLHELNQFYRFARPRGLDLTNEQSSDRLLRDYLNEMYADGHQSYRADRLLAAVAPPPGVWENGEQASSTLLEGIEGLSKTHPWQERKSVPAGFVECHGRRDEKKRSLADGLVFDGGVVKLLPPLGAVESQGSLPGQASGGSDASVVSPRRAEKGAVAVEGPPKCGAVRKERQAGQQLGEARSPVARRMQCSASTTLGQSS